MNQMKTHVKATQNQSISKTLWRRDAEALVSDSVLLECLSIYGVNELTLMKVNDDQSEILVSYRPSDASKEEIKMRAHKVDAFMGGWLAATRKHEGMAGYQPL